MEGYSFILQLHNSLIPNQLLGNNFRFVKWMRNGGLQFKISANQRKTIPVEILMLAYHIYSRNKRIKRKVLLNVNWLKANGYSDWCFIDVLKFLVKTYKIK